MAKTSTQRSQEFRARRKAARLRRLSQTKVNASQVNPARPRHLHVKTQDTGAVFTLPDSAVPLLAQCRQNAAINETFKKQRAAYVESLRRLLDLGVSERDLATAILKRNSQCCRKRNFPC